MRWPELLGKNGTAAKATIEKENPEVTAEILTRGRVGPPTFCCNRVFVIVDTHGDVTNIPTIG
ncbi:hypothetical protein CXB51_010788 [Gossypium anomalum]|uniref:Uncharacterized protein n=1 Tax=Gossypium anomalum TaxID=47600 RepID=A0A8J5Z9F4_9ROSI|nr:hypothetical protein CXB51_010788 [Gossypium anomalum]